MRAFPIIPIWLMLVISGILVLFIIKGKKRLLQKSTIMELLMILLLFLINLRIMTPSGKAQVAANNLDVIFVIDKSISMIASDYKTKTRLEGLKESCTSIIENLEGARFSVITFDNGSNILIPLTSDSNMTKESIEVIQVKDEWAASGSTLNAPLENMLKVLKSSKEKGDRVRILFYISDGELTRDGETLSSFESVKEYVDNGAVLGFGTEEGATMYIGVDKSLAGDYYGGYIYDTLSGEKSISTIDENNLKKIANDIAIDYIHVENVSDINAKVKEIKRLSTSDFEKTNKSSYEDTYYFLFIPLLLLFLFSFKEYKGVYK